MRRRLVPGDEDGAGVTETASGDAAALGEDLIEGERGGAEGRRKRMESAERMTANFASLSSWVMPPMAQSRTARPPPTTTASHEDAGGETGVKECGSAVGSEEESEEPAEEVGEDAAKGDEHASADGEEDLHAEVGPVDARRVFRGGWRHDSLLPDKAMRGRKGWAMTRMGDAEGPPHGTLRIESGCWLGYNAAVVSGRGDVVIGRNSVIGANSVVTTSFPPFSIIGGNPARLIRQFDSAEGVWRHCQQRPPSVATPLEASSR